MDAIDYVARAISIAALAISVVALFFTFRKDAHRIAITKSQDKYQGIVLRVSNDSSFSVGVWGVGYFTESGAVTWIERVGNHQTNKFVSYPVRIEARAAFPFIVVSGREVPESSVPHGYCIQLESGRTFVLRGSAPAMVAMKMHLRSLLSRVTAGSVGFLKREPVIE